MDIASVAQTASDFKACGLVTVFLGALFAEPSAMVSKSKLYRQLDALESELRERLVPHIEAAALGRNDLVFCVREFNPYPQLANRTDATTESLIVLGRKILGLMEKLGEPSTGTIAERICWYCYEWGNVSDSHRKSAKTLAQQFLEEIRSASDEHGSSVNHTLENLFQ